jgi:hypothetical protein
MFADIHPQWMQFFEWLQHQHAANEFFLYNIMWMGGTASVVYWSEFLATD